ncbi:MAG: dihydropteroate synthase [Polyangiales bacterium]
MVGVVNVTPDSFSDGGLHLSAESAREHVDRVIEEGADVIEVGGESTRPAGKTYGEGFSPVDPQVQVDRVMPAIEHAVKRGARVAIDTTRAEVAKAALDAGASIVNDVSLLSDPSLAPLCAARGAWLVLMHSRPGSASSYDDVIDDLAREWSSARDRANAEGVPSDKILMDPGIGFGKGAADNLRVLAGLSRLHALGHPLYVGASRKAFIGAAEEEAGLSRSEPRDRVGGTVAACLSAAQNGAAVLRVHDVRAVRQALAVHAGIGGA